MPPQLDADQRVVLDGGEAHAFNDIPDSGEPVEDIVLTDTITLNGIPATLPLLINSSSLTNQETELPTAMEPTRTFRAFDTDVMIERTFAGTIRITAPVRGQHSISLRHDDGGVDEKLRIYVRDMTPVQNPSERTPPGP